MRMLLLAVMWVASATTQAQGLYPPFPRFAMHASGADEFGAPTGSARLCVLPAGVPCFVMPSAPEPGNPAKKDFYLFGLEPKAERLPLQDGGSLVFFSASFYGGGSGSLDRLAVLRFDPRTNILTNLLPYVAVTNISERAMLPFPNASPYPLLVTADFIWGEGETHFDPHRFVVEAWRINFVSDHYERIMTYRTTRTYSVDPGPARVLAAERGEIDRRIAAAR